MIAGLSLNAWWVWVAAALILGILEVIAPGFIFLGFAAGAAATGVLTMFVDWSATWLLVFFAAASLVAWIVMKMTFGGRGSQVKTFDQDVND